MQRYTLVNAHLHRVYAYHSFGIQCLLYQKCNICARLSCYHTPFSLKRTINIYTRSTFTSSLTILFEFEIGKKREKSGPPFIFSRFFLQTIKCTICWYEDLVCDTWKWKKKLSLLSLSVCVCASRIYLSAGWIIV